MSLVYTNNAQSTLLAGIAPTDTQIQLPVGEGSRFPDISASDDDWFPLTLISTFGDIYEIVKATSRSSDTITIERAQENTPLARAFSTASIVSLRMTSAAFDEFLRNGLTSVTLPRGINLATQTNQLTQPYALELDNAGELVDGLRICFKPLVQNEATNVSIKLNNTATTAALVGFREGAIFNVGELKTDQFYEFYYSADKDRWMLDTPLADVGINSAGIITSGLVELYNEYDVDAKYDTETNPVSYSGAPKVFDRKGISKIIRDSHTMVRIPAKWRNYGVGSIPITVLSASSLTRHGSIINNYNRVTVPIGEQLHCGNVSVIRASELVSISGDIIIAHMTKSKYPETFIGPAGSTVAVTPTGYEPDYIPHQERAYGNITAGAIYEVINGIEEDEAFQLFHGGHGRGKTRPGVLDAHVRGRGTLIIIAPKITIASTSKLYLPVRYAEEDTTFSETNGSGTRHANTSSGGGGLLILSTPDLTISDTTKVKVSGPSEPYVNYSTVRAGFGLIPVQEKWEGADTGKIFHIDPENDTIELLV